jgi:hypothetical protein
LLRSGRRPKLGSTVSPIHQSKENPDMATALHDASSVRRLNTVAALPCAWFVRGAEREALQIGLAELTELLGGAADPLVRDNGERFAVHRVARGTTLVHEGAHAAMLYVVQTGSFKSVKTAEDGYEHVLGFAWRRDVIGYDGLYREHYAFGAVALEDSRVIVLPMAALPALCQQSPRSCRPWPPTCGWRAFWCSSRLAWPSAANRRVASCCG